MKDRLVLVTGGTGYVGSALVPVLAKKYPVRVYCAMNFGNPIADTPNVEFIKGDVRDSYALSDAVKGCTDIIHLAGVVTDELVDMNPSMGQHVNEKGTEYICGLALQHRVNRLIYASSSSVYGSQDKECTERDEPKPQTAYAASKLAGERTVLRYAEEDMVTTAVRSATLCGPAPRMRLDTIVNIFSKQAFFDGEIDVWGGDQYRSNIHVDDIVDLYMTLLDAPAEKIDGEVFNATQGNHTARDLGNLVAGAYNRWFSSGVINPLESRFGLPPIVYTYVDSSKHDGRHYRMDSSKLGRVLGWKPKRTIEDAVRANLEYFHSGGIADPNDDIYYNTRRMADVVKP